MTDENQNYTIETFEARIAADFHLFISQNTSGEERANKASFKDWCTAFYIYVEDGVIIPMYVIQDINRNLKIVFELIDALKFQEALFYIIQLERQCDAFKITHHYPLEMSRAMYLMRVMEN